jgi:hypothetical protein
VKNVTKNVLNVNKNTTVLNVLTKPTEKEPQPVNVLMDTMMPVKKSVKNVTKNVKPVKPKTVVPNVEKTEKVLIVTVKKECSIKTESVPNVPTSVPIVTNLPMTVPPVKVSKEPENQNVNVLMDIMPQLTPLTVKNVLVNVPLVIPPINVPLVLLTETEKIVVALMVPMKPSNINSVIKDVPTDLTRNPMDLADHVKTHVMIVITVTLVLLVKPVPSEKEKPVPVKKDTMKLRDNLNVKNVLTNVKNVTIKVVPNVMKEEDQHQNVHVKKELSIAKVTVNLVLKIVNLVLDPLKTVPYVLKEEKITNQHVTAQKELMKKMMYAINVPPTVKLVLTPKNVPLVKPQDLDLIVLVQKIISRKRVTKNVTNVETIVTNVVNLLTTVPFVEKT